MLYTEKYDCIYSASGAGGRDPNDLTEEFKVPLNHYACYSDIYKHIRYLPYSYSHSFSYASFPGAALIMT